MIIFAVLLVSSVGLVLLAERYPRTRCAMQQLTAAYAPGTCRSFILDIPLLLPLVGLLVTAVSRKVTGSGAMLICNVACASIAIFGFASGNGAISIAMFATLTASVVMMLATADVRPALFATAIGIFWTISGALYLDYLNLSVLAPILGHPEAWGGNHFMWNSGAELAGLNPFVNTDPPTYKDFWGFWNIIAMALFAAYPFIMVKAGRRLHGLLFGYTAKQTGIWALFFERKAKI